jgi:prepilin-type N-terminal cleavage/methylation domain-containing protein
MKRRSRGYTLMEMMVAVGIVGIIGLIAIPVSTRMRERSFLNSAVREFAAKITQARAASATSTSHPTWPPGSRVRSAGIRFVTSTQYTVFIDRDLQPNGDEVDIAIVDLNQSKRDNLVTITQPAIPGWIRFNNNGTLTNGAPIDVVFSDVHERTPKTIRVSLAGMPKIMN